MDQSGPNKMNWTKVDLTDRNRPNEQNWTKTVLVNIKNTDASKHIDISGINIVPCPPCFSAIIILFLNLL